MMHFMMTATMDTGDRLLMDMDKHMIAHLDEESTTQGEVVYNRNIDETWNRETVVARGW